MEGDTPSRCESCTKIGIITTTTGVLFMKAEASATSSSVRMIVMPGFVSARLSAWLVSHCSAPGAHQAAHHQEHRGDGPGRGIGQNLERAVVGQDAEQNIAAAPAIAMTSAG